MVAGASLSTGAAYLRAVRLISLPTEGGMRNGRPVTRMPQVEPSERQRNTEARERERERESNGRARQAVELNASLSPHIDRQTQGKLSLVKKRADQTKD